MTSLGFPRLSRCLGSDRLRKASASAQIAIWLSLCTATKDAEVLRRGCQFAIGRVHQKKYPLPRIGATLLIPSSRHSKRLAKCHPRSLFHLPWLTLTKPTPQTETEPNLALPLHPSDLSLTKQVLCFDGKFWQMAVQSERLQLTCS